MLTREDLIWIERALRREAEELKTRKHSSSIEAEIGIMAADRDTSLADKFEELYNRKAQQIRIML